MEGKIVSLCASLLILNILIVFQAFWDSTGPLWAAGALAGKYASFFVSTGTPGGGQEMTVMNSISTLTHHGIMFVPLGYSHAFPQLSNMNELHGGM
jgi:NAD(P)H dehydrogenase (quinone)